MRDKSLMMKSVSAILLEGLRVKDMCAIKAAKIYVRIMITLKATKYLDLCV